VASRRKKQKRNHFDDVRPQARQAIGAVAFVVLGVFFLLSALGSAGMAGETSYAALRYVFGFGFYLAPIACALYVYVFLYPREDQHISTAKIVGIAVLFFSLLGLLGLLRQDAGGLSGMVFAWPLTYLLGQLASGVLLAALAVVGALLTFNIGIRVPRFRQKEKSELQITSPFAEGSVMEDAPTAAAAEKSAEPPLGSTLSESAQHRSGFSPSHFRGPYAPPPLSLLEKDKGTARVGDVKASANIIKRTLQNFGIEVEMDEVSIGPTVTRYALKPAEGVRISKIVGLQNNLELALAAHPVRIEAPIPGKSLVGIEVPNSAKSTVGLASLLSSPEYTDSPKPLLVALGKDIAGNANFANIAQMPHMLIAGTTGSGKTCGKDTYVFTEKGMLTFDELCPLPLNTNADYTLRVATRDGIETTSKNYNNGICDFCAITTEDGFSIEVTDEHPLWVLENGSTGWKSGGAIQVGEYVAIARGSKLFGTNTTIDFVPKPHVTNKARPIRLPACMTPDLGLFLGLLTADGGLTIGHRIVYTQANEEVLHRYIRLLADLFGIVQPSVEKSGQSNKAKDVIVNSKNLKDFLAHLGMPAVGAQEKEIPRAIRESGPDTVAAFIRGLIRNDGHVSAHGLEITLASKTLLRQLQIVLLNFGVVAALHPKTVRGYEHNAYWRLSVYGDDFATYATEIGFMTDEEREKARRFLARPRNTNWDTIPTLPALLKRMKKMYRDTFARLTNTGWHYRPDALVPKYAFHSLPSYNSGDRHPSYTALGKILALYQPLSESGEYQQLAQIHTSNFYWAKVAAIKQTRGVGYDFEVPGSHSFVGNGFINHNSVTIHALVTSLLFRNSPEQLRFIMVDPKRVELTLYNGIPHLLTPVITDAKKTILALKWAAKEMERRYDILQSERVRDLSSYHDTIYFPARDAAKKSGGEEMPEPLPYIVVIIDELADIMQAYPREMEACIVRLAQMSRAVGIHLILSTQRPSVNVITGLIKANIPTRLALQVASQIDSRTILDQIGAEKLLGAGDTLFLSGEMSKPKRIQSAYLREEEVKRVTEYLRKQHDVQSLDALDLSVAAGGDERSDAFFESMNTDGNQDDDLYEEAKAIVLEAGKASTSYLQRRLRIGYSRAARLIDILEERGVIGAADGGRPREVLAGNGGGDAEAS
jgi:hypothetical protein